MKNIVIAFSCFLTLTAAAAAQDGAPQRGIDQMPGKRGKQTQELNGKGQPVVKSKDNAPVELKAGETIKRGVALGQSKAERVSLEDAMKSPQKYAGKIMAVEGIIVRSCKKEGCWMELAPKTDAKSVRVTFGDHAFFVPLNAAGLNAKAEGKLEVKTLSKEKVDHLVNDDGAKIDRNPDGTANEITFVATGVELTKNSN